MFTLTIVCPARGSSHDGENTKTTRAVVQDLYPAGRLLCSALFALSAFTRYRLAWAAWDAVEVPGRVVCFVDVGVFSRRLIVLDNFLPLHIWLVIRSHLLLTSPAHELVFAALRTVTLWPRGMAELLLTDAVGKRPARGHVLLGFLSGDGNASPKDDGRHEGWTGRGESLGKRRESKTSPAESRGSRDRLASAVDHPREGRGWTEGRSSLPLDSAKRGPRRRTGPWWTVERVCVRRSRCPLAKAGLGSGPGDWDPSDTPTLPTHLPWMGTHMTAHGEAAQQGQPARQPTARSFPHCPGREAFG